MQARIATVCFLALTAHVAHSLAQTRQIAEPQNAPRFPLSQLESKLSPLCGPLPDPKPGEWLHEHKEPGQTFAQYLQAQPVRRSQKLRRIYLCLLGNFTDKQLAVLDRTREYLALYFDTPVQVHARVPLHNVPNSARRKHPTWGDSQILSTWVLNQLLKPNIPEDALAYLAFTSSDLWPGENWNFVFGQANLHDRTGVWSLYRNGNPALGDNEYNLCLRRTLRTASHETGHILTMKHCTAFACNMNGVNHQAEGDSKPLHLCSVCLHKLCWNLQVDPIPYLHRLQTFAETHNLPEEAQWYARAIRALSSSD